MRACGQRCQIEGSIAFQHTKIVQHLLGYKGKHILQADRNDLPTFPQLWSGPLESKYKWETFFPPEWKCSKYNSRTTTPVNLAQDFMDSWRSCNAVESYNVGVEDKMVWWVREGVVLTQPSIYPSHLSISSPLPSCPSPLIPNLLLGP